MGKQYSENDIAIVGMACRFPGANSPQEYWTLLKDGREALSALTDEQLIAEGVPKATLRNRNYVKSGMFLQNMEQFDGEFFGLSPLDSKIMDPQHRHFLECGWEAFEDAGYDPAAFDGSIGVFAGSGHNAYMPYNLLSNPELLNDVGFFLIRHTGNDKDFLSTRMSYLFDLKGPSVNVQTACSTSLVAVHMAVQSLLNGESDMVLAGGVTIELPHHQGYLFKDNEILSPDGHCRPFEAGSQGTVFGSGVGIVILRRVEDAIADGDNIHAIIKSSAINNDGAGKVSYLAPSVGGQADVVNEALEIARIEPQTVGYIECHGTGTQMGDPIEVAALTQAYGGKNPRKQYCAIGSVKSNIGHLDTAAGAASLIKAVLALKHQQIPATLHYRQPNPAIDFADSPFYVNDQLREWPGENLRAGVSSLGVGGTNAHVIVQNYAPQKTEPSGHDWHLLPLSGRSEKALLKGCNRLSRFLEAGDPPVSLEDVSYTLAAGRRRFSKRRFAVVSAMSDAINVLEGGDTQRLISRESTAENLQLAFMFAGGGAQYPNMGRGLYQWEKGYRNALDECLSLLPEFIDFDLKSLLYPEPGEEEQAALELERPSRALPALFVTQYAQAQLWISKGVKPVAMIGHSMGENTAACIAGVIKLRDALGLVSLRGRLFETIEPGGMLSVQLGQEELKDYLTPELDLAAANAPGISVVSGKLPLLEALESKLAEDDVMSQRVRINIAAHSRMLEPMLQDFGAYLQAIELASPTIPFVSNRSGTWIKEAEATDPQYWVEHLRQTVRFGEGVNTLLQGERLALLEVGPGNTLSSLATMSEHLSAQSVVLSSMRHPSEELDDRQVMLTALGQLWAGGADIDWQAWFADQRPQKISLPAYAFDHARHWVEPGVSVFSGGVASSGADRKADINEFFYQPAWLPRMTPSAQFTQGARVLWFASSTAPGEEQLAAVLANHPIDIVKVLPGSAYSINGNEARVRPDHSDDFVHLVSDLLKSASFPEYILYSWPLENQGAAIGNYEQQRAYAFDGQMFLAQAIANEDIAIPISWLTVTAHAQRVAGEAVNTPISALIQGPARVIPNEIPNICCASIDIADAGNSAQVIVASLSRLEAPTTLALRDNQLFEQSYAQPQTSASGSHASEPALREKGIYLISGGTGGLGLVAAHTLADASPVRLALMSRHAIPEREHWPTLIAVTAPESQMLQSILALERKGSEVFFLQADVSDVAAVQRAAGLLAEHWGEPNGIIHTAGVIDDGLLLLKDIAEAHAVLAPKVLGTMVLDQVFGGKPIDFFLMYSSTSAHFGLPGQIDYTAANAFMDAWCNARSGQGRSLTINWPAWNEAGMALAVASGTGPRQAAGRPVSHPLLDRCISDDAPQVVYSTLFSVEKYWLLAEHRIKEGPALIPGSGFIELARAAFEEHTGKREIKISSTQFLLPFLVSDHETRELRVQLTGQPSGMHFVIASEVDGERTEHASGSIEAASLAEETLAIDAIAQRCQSGQQRFTDPDHHPHFDFGPRWSCLQSVAIGYREALIRLQLDQPYQEELTALALHPAILDMATAGAQVIIDGHEPKDEVYVPVGYHQLVFGGELAGELVSHVTLRQPEGGKHGRDIAQFDIKVCDTSGRVLLAVHDFTMQRLTDTRALAQGVTRHEEVDRALKLTLEMGIDNEEGAAVLSSLLAAPIGPQVIVSPYRLSSLRDSLLASQNAQPAVSSHLQHDADADPDIPHIESALLDADSLETVVVRSHLDEDTQRRLVAHYVVAGGAGMTVSEMRKHARSCLPAELVPQYYIEHDEIARVADGALDRGSLADPLSPQDNYMAPRTSIEKHLARIWQDVLGVEQVGLNHNFFDLGGHSLLSIRVIIRIDKKYGIRLDQATMVLHTLEQIAQEVAEKTGGSGSTTHVADIEKTVTRNAKTPKRKGFVAALLGRK
jgi:acyl transferase domain-containing protein/acyl carrier protein